MKRKILLLAINTKYIHTNLAIYSLRQFSVQEEKKRSGAACAEEYARHILLREYTINHAYDVILRGIYEVRPEVLCISCYLWNIRMVRELVADYRKLEPSVHIFLGGPEVSYDADACLKSMPGVDGILVGEGEETFSELAACYLRQDKVTVQELSKIDGMVLRMDDGSLVTTTPRKTLDFASIPFPYGDMENLGGFAHKILYYETSRGCPFSCCYCLSSIEKTLRLRPWEQVRRELQIFLDNRVEQVKFVDRTFNCNKEHAMRIWRYLAQQDNGVTNFHFEIAADLLDEEELDLLATLRPGLVQLEIGVQSTNPKTIAAIRRHMDPAKVAEHVAGIRAGRNIHQHLDLIAGLPYEDYASFGRSFDDVYAMRPNQLQLGFLKVLKGSAMAQMTAEHGVEYKSEPPYEVLSTKYLPYEDVLKLKDIEEMVEVYYNSGQYTLSVPYLAECFGRPFAMFEALARFYRENNLFECRHSRMERAELLYRFAAESIEKKEKDCGSAKPESGKELTAQAIRECFTECLLYDLYGREKPKVQPSFAPPVQQDKEELRALFACFGVDKEHAGQCYVMRFSYDMDSAAEQKTLARENVCLFDYSKRDVLTGAAMVQKIRKDEKEDEG